MELSVYSIYLEHFSTCIWGSQVLGLKTENSLKVVYVLNERKYPPLPPLPIIIQSDDWLLADFLHSVK